MTFATKTPDETTMAERFSSRRDSDTFARKQTIDSLSEVSDPVQPYPENSRETLRGNGEVLARLFDLSDEERELLVTLAEQQMGISGDENRRFSHLPDKPWLFTPTAPLRKYRLIEAKRENGSSQQFLLSERIQYAFLGIHTMDAQLQAFVTEPDSSGFLPPSRQEFAEKVGGILLTQISRRPEETGNTGREAPEKRKGRTIEMTGTDRAGLQDVAIAAMDGFKVRPYLLRIRSILMDPFEEAEFIELWNREARLEPIAAIADLSGEEKPNEIARILEIVLSLKSPVLILTPRPTRGKFLRIQLPELLHTEQDLLWERSLGPAGQKLKDQIYNLTNNFLLKPADIERIAAMALATDPEAKNGESVLKEIWKEARKASRPAIEDLALLIESTARLADLAMDTEGLARIEEIIHRVRNQRRVLHDGGFAQRGSRGFAVTALFYGPSGTGKTHASEAIAGELGLDLYRVDLSRVVSKYIGETEKNLGRIFDGARNSGAVILFDEADALFGKRSEVTDAHDRYANQEISYLLQKMEEYRGLSILTSNLEKNMDDAFNRRITYRIGFKLPDAPSRRAIWEKIFPPETAVRNLRYDELAKELELTGAEIKNLALRSAYIAAASNEPVQMKHIRQILKDELMKVNIVLQEGELLHWFKDE